MALSFLPSLLLSLVVFFLLHSTTNGAKKSYVVYMGAQSHLLDASLQELESVTNSHLDLLASFVGRHINGFAAMLDEKEAAEIAKDPKVISVFPNLPRKLHTTRSWEFLGLTKKGKIPVSSAWKAGRFGEDVVIGTLDTGAWPESKSFQDKGYGPIPAKWRGICQPGHKDGVRCNRKLIGVRYFNKGYAADIGTPLNESLNSARDLDGHGSHTLSTAGGNFVPHTSILNISNGTASGGSPRARVAAYKVCWPVPNTDGVCYDADIMAAVDAAISDGVDVLSMSIGRTGGYEFFTDGISISSFHAIKNNIAVVCSAGNDGPTLETVTNVAPWIFTVGASTTDRNFANYVSLGNKKQIKGISLSASGVPGGKFYPLISAANGNYANTSTTSALLCFAGSLDPKKVKGKVVLCLRGENARVEKGNECLRVGAVGMILANNVTGGNDLSADPHVLPASHINYTDGQIIFAYLNRTKDPTASITEVKTLLGVEPAPFMAAFSSRGPSTIEPTILKPDITAPGVSILAAYTEAASPTGLDNDKRRFPYSVLSGTSMSCPHVAGIVGLLKTQYPHWSPSAIKSAIMTTGKTRDNTRKSILDSSTVEATPFAYGSGHVNPNSAMDPGLVYDAATEDYLNFLCARGYNDTMIRLLSQKPYSCPDTFSIEDFNYPSIVVPNIQARKVTLTRTVTNVGSPSTYNVRVRQPFAVFVTVKPRVLEFKTTGEKKTFQVIITPNFAKLGTRAGYVFGDMIWSDGKHSVRSPIAVNLAS
ncbi:subtilisin-like protease SBT5.4 isoform X2 [Quercus lobata]|uniref:subtilisin-like protease SBT5.4 isoform X2 n=1 Tax=Quercus lobata TaxID=97700 RepID=UPI0012462078|nr:subtilisin-like protease SBT5.4 isoform X2 [Quercus lobata]